MKNVVLEESLNKLLKLKAKANVVPLSRLVVMDVTAHVVKPKNEMVQANANVNLEIANVVPGARNKRFSDNNLLNSGIKN